MELKVMDFRSHLAYWVISKQGTALLETITARKPYDTVSPQYITHSIIMLEAIFDSKDLILICGKLWINIWTYQYTTVLMPEANFKIYKATCRPTMFHEGVAFISEFINSMFCDGKPTFSKVTLCSFAARTELIQPMSLHQSASLFCKSLTMFIYCTKYKQTSARSLNCSLNKFVRYN